MPRRVKTLVPDNLAKPGRAPLVSALQEIDGMGLSTFREVEDVFLRAMQSFDALIAEGIADQGDARNGKGDFFNDLLALLLARCSDKSLYTRPGIPGLSFRRHMFDIAYPATGQLQLAIETKSTGIPKHKGSPKQGAQGRAGSADLEKRIKEASFKNIDIKAETARLTGKGGGPTTDLGSWMKRALPRCYMFLSVRVRDDNDVRKTIEFGQIAQTWFDGCGLYCYGWNPAGTNYESKSVGATSLELDRVLSGVCTALRALP